MAKSDVPPLATTYLYHQVRHWRHYDCAVHDHPFWQTEINCSGRLCALVAGQEIDVEPGNAVLIPPDTPHGFTSHGQETAFVSVKFRHPLEDLDGQSHLLADDSRSRAIAAIIVDILPAQERPDGRLAQLIGHLTGALVASCLQVHECTGDSFHRLPLVERIRHLVDHRAHRRLTVAEIADELGMTTRHVSGVFRAATGMSLKNHIDACRLERAREMLTFGDGSITDVAEHLDFPDLHAFSRFFSRGAGIPPAKYRSESRANLPNITKDRQQLAAILQRADLRP